MLDKSGFKRKTYDDIFSEMEIKAKEQFGENIQTKPTSVMGMFLRVVSKGMATIYNVIEKVYGSGFVSQAEGVQLDRLADNVGLFRLPASNAIATLEFVGKPDYVVEVGTLFETEEKRIIFELLDEVKLNADGKGKGLAASIEFGYKTNVDANTIIVQTEPVEEIEKVNNPFVATNGKDEETDNELRERIKASVKANAGTTINGLKTAVLNVPGVAGVNVIDNKTLEVDKNGNPPKSVHIYVLGGERNDLANAIFDSIAAGIETVGEQVVTVNDIGNYEHEVKFDYAEQVKLFAKIDVLTSGVFEIDGEEKIKQAVQDAINHLSMGEIVKYSYIFPELYKIKGVINATVKIGLTKESLEAKDISIKPYEYARVSLDDVEVVINV